MARRDGAVQVGRYELYGEIASGGMATVYYGRVAGALGFARTVAIKRIHPHLSRDPDFASMFVDEVRLAARVVHPNVVQTLDVVMDGGEAFLVMEHVLGEPLSRLIRACRAEDERIPVATATGIMSGILHGLHAAHEARSERGEPLHIVHRDVSPQNILVGADGVPRLIDFGVAKGVGRMQTTGEGQIKGKFAYMSPEQLGGDALDRRSDVYSAGVVLWEMLTGRPLVAGENNMAVLKEALTRRPEAPSVHAPDLPQGLDQAVLRALARDPVQRFPTALAFARAVEDAVRVANPSQISEWVRGVAGVSLAKRAQVVSDIESGKSEVVSLASLAPGRAPGEAATHVSTILSSTRGADAAKPPSRPVRVATIGGVVLLAFAALGWMLFVRARPEATLTPPAAVGASAREDPAAAPSSSPSAAEVPTPSSTSVAASSSAPARIARPPRPASPAGHAAPRASPPASPAKSGGDCRVEQYVDADGFVRFRCAP